MDNTMETTFGKSLRLERQKRKLTQEQLAKILETSQQNIAGMEAGRSLPKEAMFYKMCELFGRHSAVAQLPPRGVIKIAYDTVEDARVKSETHHVVSEVAPRYKPSVIKVTPLSSQAQELGELFDMLPQDRIIRVGVHRECTGLLLSHLDRYATASTSPEATLAHKL